MRLDQLDAVAVNRALNEMRGEAVAIVRAGAPTEALAESRSAYMRYVGQGYEIQVPIPCRELQPSDEKLLRGAFDEVYSALNVRAIPGANVEILTWSVTVSTIVAPPARVEDPGEEHNPIPLGSRRLFDPDRQGIIDVPFYRRSDLRPGACIPGPALVVENETSVFVSSGFIAKVGRKGYIVLECSSRQKRDA
jgi:N-methylhydantoinase A